MENKSEWLPAAERVSILTRRLANLNRWSGDYSPGNRVQACAITQSALAEAVEDFMRGGAR